jgi:2-C-methyl-D-erythritol 4-phosphate cytidylyltransferase / 2-C-methyl-D-erythritol 2,4-cyclodiphosphate synthase
MSLASLPKLHTLAIIVAAGRGARFGTGRAKQYHLLAGETVLRRTIQAFSDHAAISAIQVVIHPDDGANYTDAVAGLGNEKLLAPVFGGATRQHSVLSGLEALQKLPCDVVLIHDAARPFVSTQMIEDAVAAAVTYGAAVPGAPVTDTIIGLSDHTIAATLDRSKLRAVQTPQAFRYDLILAAHTAAAEKGQHHFTDDGSVAVAAGHPVHVFTGDSTNVKITTQDDLYQAETRLGQATPLVSRTATGFDVHAFGEGDHVWLCGVKIPHPRGLIGHSDADVALHAITDALLGAMADGDIGRHFPPSDAQWKGASSDQFLTFAADRLRQRGGIIDLLDVTIICEEPKIGPHADAMRRRIAEIASVGLNAVSVKATTTERLGFTGRKEGISALASATIRLG